MGEMSPPTAADYALNEAQHLKRSETDQDREIAALKDRVVSLEERLTRVERYLTAVTGGKPQ